MTQKTFFTSDVHFGHANIIRFCNRPYASVEEMDEAIVAHWNETVGQNDYIYILGDLSFSNADRTTALVKRLNGIKVLVYGNHDKVIRNNRALRDMFAETHEFLERDFKLDGVPGKGKKFVMCHYALRVWNKSHHGSFHLFGHSHGSLPDDGSRSMDVGLDANNMRILSLKDVFDKLGSRELKVVDHHETAMGAL